MRTKMAVMMAIFLSGAVSGQTGTTGKMSVEQTLRHAGQLRAEQILPPHYHERIISNLPGGAVILMVSSAQDGRIYYVLKNDNAAPTCVRVEWGFEPDWQALRYAAVPAAIIDRGQYKIMAVIDHTTGPNSALNFTGQIFAWPARTDVSTHRCSSALPQGMSWPTENVIKEYSVPN